MDREGCRNTCTPDVAIELNKVWWQTDIRGVLPAVQVPTLLIVDQDSGDSALIAEHVVSLMPNAVVETFPLTDGRRPGMRSSG